MVFQSFNFLLLFLPLVAFLYYLLPKNFLRNIVLVISSFIFYAWGNPLWAMLLICASIVDFFLAQKIHHLNLVLETYEKSGNALKQRRIKTFKTVLLIFSIIFNIGLLAFFKYWDWVIDLIDIAIFKKLGWKFFDITSYQHHIPLPPAISFYTFETLSYTIDIYRRQFKPTRHFIDYLSFIAFFPKLVAGPIMRAHELLPQLARFRAKVSSRNLEFALFLIFWGLFKKLVIADNLGHVVLRCREKIHEPGVGLLLALAFSYQFYCDFSAYCDIGRGVAKLFSIRLKRNFLTPFFSSNLTIFFQRWNITFYTWIRDYVYYPMIGKGHNPLRNNLSFFFVMFLIGLWHGPGIFFIACWLYAAVIMMIYRKLSVEKLLRKFCGVLVGKIISYVINFFVIVYGMMILWSKTSEEFLQASSSFFQIFNFASWFPLKKKIFLGMFPGVMIFILPIFVTDLLGFRKKREFIDLYISFNLITKIVIYLLMFYLVLFLAFRGSYDFIYFRF